MAILINTINVTGEYAGTEFVADSTVEVELGSVYLLKTADKETWDDGDLTYTITLRNIEDTGNVSDIVFSDTIDITKSRMLTDSMTINGTAAVEGVDFTYNAVSGVLEVIYPSDLAPGQEVTIIFRVRKV